MAGFSFRDAVKQRTGFSIGDRVVHVRLDDKRGGVGIIETDEQRPAFRKAGLRVYGVRWITAHGQIWKTLDFVVSDALRPCRDDEWPWAKPIAEIEDADNDTNRDSVGEF